MSLPVVLLFIIGALCLLYGVMVFMIRSGTTFFVVWFALGALFLLLGFLLRNHFLARVPRVLRTLLLIAVCAGVIMLAVCESFVVQGFSKQAPAGLDYLIVLGAQVREDGPSAVLKYRLDAAADYLRRPENEGTICIVTGGKGAAEIEGVLVGVSHGKGVRRIAGRTVVGGDFLGLGVLAPGELQLGRIALPCHGIVGQFRRAGRNLQGQVTILLAGTELEGLDILRSIDDGKAVIIFASGMGIPTKETRENLIEQNVLGDYHLRFYQLRGSFDYSKLKFADRLVFDQSIKAMSRDPESAGQANDLDWVKSNPILSYDQERVDYICGVIQKIKIGEAKK